MQGSKLVLYFYLKSPSWWLTEIIIPQFGRFTASQTIYINELQLHFTGCPPDSEITRTCDINGGNAKWQLSQTKYMLEGGQCTPHEISWQEPINCTEGLVDQKRGPKLPNGLQEVQLVFETLVGCKCIQGVKRLQCPWRKSVIRILISFTNCMLMLHENVNIFKVVLNRLNMYIVIRQWVESLS